MLNQLMALAIQFIALVSPLFPSPLLGVQSQRVALAIAVPLQPSVLLLLDEPPLLTK